MSHYDNGAYHCPACGKVCDTVYVWRGGGEVVECDCYMAAHYADSAGYEDFVCPNGCKQVQRDYAEIVYIWKGSGEGAGCQHCIQEVDICELA